MPKSGIIYPMGRKNNRVKSVFLDEKDSIFALSSVCVKVEKQRG
jgi:hypothetical protein